LNLVINKSCVPVLEQHIYTDLDQHISLCHTHDNTIDIMPKKGEDDSVKFRNHERKLKHPFVLYADFESIIKPIHGSKPSTDNSFFNS